LKYLLVLVVLVAVYWIFKSTKRKIQRGPRPPAGRLAEDMVRCAQCGVHLPRSESLTSRDASYCSVEHRRLREPD